MSEPAPRKRAAKGRGPELRGELLTAAMDLLRETGDEAAMSLRAVAGRVGVSVPSIYLHFADKQALLDAVCEEVFEQLHTAMREAAEDASDPFEGLFRQGVAYVHFALANPEHYRIVFTPRPGPQDDTSIAIGAFGYLLGSIEQCIAAGVFTGDPVSLGTRLWASAHGVASLLIAKPAFPWPDRERFIADTICMAGMGLAVESRYVTEQGVTTLPEILERLDRLRG